MACAITTKTTPLNIEDIIINKDVSYDTVQKNIPKYKEMVSSINEWIYEIMEKTPDCDIRKEFNKYYSHVTRKHRVYVKKSLLIHAYKLMTQNPDKREIEEEHPLLHTLLQKRPIRNMSGVTVITVLTSPYPDGQDFSCKHNCYYCPAEPDMPRSYLKKEPAVARGFRNNWDAKLQMIDRLNALMVNGHNIDKLEIIIEGGTYTEYPREYLEHFHRDLIYIANTYFSDPEARREPLSLDEEVAANSVARVRIIGICIETRPDAFINDPEYDSTWVEFFRRAGVTRVQLGVQHTDNMILKKINRGHTIEDAEHAIKYLKENCFKVDIHLMPDLPNATPEKDMDMIDYVFQTPNLQPDQIKIYPCEVTPWTVIKDWHDRGKYTPYAETDERALLDVVKYAMATCPPWMRLPRVIRDIPSTYIQAGNKYPNLRQMLDDELKREGIVSMDIRSRECGRNLKYKLEDAVFAVRHYKASGSTEYFISCESADHRCIFGFLRLRIPSKTEHDELCEFPVLTNNTALIRELHVYGNVMNVRSRHSKNKHSDQYKQHQGVGRRLLYTAEDIARSTGHRDIAVISGIGVMDYYRKNGYYYNNTFMVKKLDRPPAQEVVYAELSVYIIILAILLLMAIIYCGIIISFAIHNV